MIKIIIAIGQLGFAISTLYRARGDQIAVYGFAAFGLTVAQYAWMSLLNLIGSLLCPEYRSMFLVESRGLTSLKKKLKARGQNDEFPVEGTVGRVSQETEQTLLSIWVKGGHYEIVFKIFVYMAFFFAPFVGAVPIAIIGVLSGFSAGDSALYQRVWSMMWLAFGSTLGPLWGMFMEDAMDPRPILQGPSQLYLDKGFKKPTWIRHIVPRWIRHVVPTWTRYEVFHSLLVYAAPAVGGLVVVGQMIVEYGVCLQISEPKPL